MFSMQNAYKDKESVEVFVQFLDSSLNQYNDTVKCISYQQFSRHESLGILVSLILTGGPSAPGNPGKPDLPWGPCMKRQRTSIGLRRISQTTDALQEKKHALCTESWSICLMKKEVRWKMNATEINACSNDLFCTETPFCIYSFIQSKGAKTYKCKG